MVIFDTCKSLVLCLFVALFIGCTTVKPSSVDLTPDHDGEHWEYVQ